MLWGGDMRMCAYNFNETSYEDGILSIYITYISSPPSFNYCCCNNIEALGAQNKKTPM